ncbi:MAG: PstS family phosphate ABC transporter substrate-binding protein [Actinomycetota bacterium]
MARRMRLRSLAAAVVLLALVGSACSKNADGNTDALGKLAGSVSIDGSSTVYLISQAVVEEFDKVAPNVKVGVGESGTGGGFKKFCEGVTQISAASRPIKDSEKQACAAKSIEYLELEIAIDGLSVVTHKSNSFVDCLTIAELKRMWEPAAEGKINNWSQIRNGFPSKPLKLYGPGTDSGTFDYFTKEINGEEGKSRSDYEASEDDNILVQGVTGTAGGLGYFGFAYYEQSADKLKLLGVDAGQGCVKPSKETIVGGTYKPLSRPLFIYVAKSATKLEQVKAFVDYYLDKVGELVADIGYIPVSESTLSREKTEWDSFSA